MDILNSESEPELNECQRKCINFAKSTKEQKRQLLMMIMGGPGTGKTFTIQHLLSTPPFKDYNMDEIALGSFSALAACNVAKNTPFHGNTLHHIFGIKVEKIKASKGEIPPIIRMLHKIRKGNTYGLKLIIIDEISMLPAHILKLIDAILKRDKSNDNLFGNVDIILSGDYEQLRPVVGESTEDHEITRNFKRFDLIEQKRTDNMEDQKLLNRVRKREITNEDICRLKKRCIDPLDDLCLRILKRNPDINDHNNTTVKEKYMPWKTKTYSFDLIEEKIDESDDLDQFKLTISNAKDDANLLDTLKIKEGCPVICRKNCKQMGLDGLEYDIFNGKLGNVYGVTKQYENGKAVDDVILVKFNDIKSIICVKRLTIEVHSGGDNPNIIAKLNQFPLHLCYAITCWKVQGMTIKDKYVIGYFPSVEEFRQLYVMLTRCEKLDNVYFSFKDHTNPYAFMTLDYFNHKRKKKDKRNILDYMTSSNVVRIEHTPLPSRANFEDIISCKDILLF
tara:strand:- start:109 stop:1626 length:1518 start_codon:yes stop_codon:yes gene_type:complete